MATNNKRTGYSDALGGYGVPAQVKITGEASLPGKPAKGAKPKGKGLVFRPKPRNIIIIAVVIVAVVAAIFFANNMLGAGRYASSIDHVESMIQPVNGADATVYNPIVAENVDWNTIDEKEREGIARYAVNNILENMENDNAGIYQILGHTFDGQQPAFLYSPNAGTIQIFENGAVKDVVPLE
jgi:hypothetical protein